MDADDLPSGRVLGRRELITLLGVGGMALLAGCRTQPGVGAGDAPPLRIVRPAQTAGPYFVDERLERSDLRPDPSDGSIAAGLPLALTVRAWRVTAAGRAPLSGAAIDLWHCDAAGAYSDVADPAFSTLGRKFLRGYQVTDEGGEARFLTIYPGWYRGRTVHIHFKVRGGRGTAPGSGFTSQMYFDDALTDRVQARAPYAARGARTTRNADDGIFRDGGDRLLLDVTETAQGCAATFDVGLLAT